MRYLVLAIVVLGCRANPGIAPTVTVGGEIEFGITYSIAIPDGYHESGSGSWDRDDRDPPIRIYYRGRTPDVSAAECKPHLLAVVSERRVDGSVAFCTEDSEYRSEHYGGSLLRVIRGRLNVDCSIEFADKWGPVSPERLKDAIAICDSLVVHEPPPIKRPEESPSVLRPEKLAAVTMPTDEELQLQIVVPGDYKLMTGFSDIIAFGHGWHELSGPRVYISSGHISSICDRDDVERSETLDDGELAVCERGDHRMILRTVKSGARELSCRIGLDRGYMAQDPISEIRIFHPIVPEVVDRQTEDAVAICKSLKVIKVSPLSNPKP